MTTASLQIEVVGAGEPRTVSLRGDAPIWIGRDPDAAVRLDSTKVSRRHASVSLTAQGLQISDNSSNGTMVNGLPLHRAGRLLPEGAAVLEIAGFALRVSVQRIADEPSRTRPSPNLIAPTPVPASGVSAEWRRSVHRKLLDHLDLSSLDRGSIDSTEMRPKVVAALRRIIAELGAESTNEAQETLVQELTDEALGLGPLEQLIADADVNEIMVVDPHTIFVERRGEMVLTGMRFTDDDAVRAVIERIVTPLGRRIDESTPLVDARLKDGSRVNAVIPPLALRGPCITIRKFAKDPLRMTDLVRFESVTAQMARFLERAVRVRKNIVISGGTGSGKTTLLNVLSGAIPERERVVTVEDAAELQLSQAHVVSLEARPPNLEGKGEYSIRDLVKNALRMRPDRIVVGECRGGEAIDMLQAMNTGHEGSLTTTHANSPKEAVARIETLCLMAGLDLPVRAIRQQIASSVHLIVQQSRYSDGSRRVSSIAEVVGIDDDGEVELREIFGFKLTHVGGEGRVGGEFFSTGYLPSFLDQFIAHGLVQDGAVL